ncbi:radical SAM family protein [Sinobacterium caligoides]|uniref:Radical SAM family protein n=1 Tax=Sinobacterium caligoides TaxID=933926 RepID=A0A3N2DQI6_9GAMM|nr:radical SAM protein [Sinobacterium caligoides]ROS01565.1 radical SAM family protein [Sinobacterium caligoides]
MFNYIEPVFRPPSEANSLILQVTNGCSWNQCSFCEMYSEAQKRFSVTASDIVEQHIIAASQSGRRIDKVFLADGDAMALSFRRLEEILLLIRQYLPTVRRVSSYCLPRNLLKKTPEQLSVLNSLGLQLMYVGCESGDDEILTLIHKGETLQSSIDALVKIKQAGMKASVMILNGMGGAHYSEQHARHSAALVNATQPEFLSTLVLSFPCGPERYQESFKGRFIALSQQLLFNEIRLFLSLLELEKTVFRSDHASNYLVLKGILGRDKSKLLHTIDQAIAHPDRTPLREEWQRGL